MKITKNRIEEVRKSYKPEITQQQIADAIGMSRQNISEIENSKVETSIGTALDIAEYLKVPVHYLFFRINDK